MNRRLLIPMGLALPLVLASVLTGLLVSGTTKPPPLPGLSVSRTRLVDDNGRALQIAGVNRAGTEYACVHGRGIFDGPTDDASIAAMASWGINAVRVPLNEDCWLGLAGVNPAFSGVRYQQAIQAFVDRLRAHNLDVILDLHWAAPGQQRALGLAPAPDADHTPAFWASVGLQFRGQDRIAFDLFNEPHQISWSCWRDGCSMPGGWRAAGMQQLIDAVRGAGARQPVIVEGLQYGSDLSGWLAHRPADQAGQLVAGWHMYNRSVCNDMPCWTRTVAPVARRFPVLATEIGETDCRGAFIGRLTAWARAQGIGYLAWTWNPFGCEAGPSLISDYSGTPTPYGTAYLTLLDSAAADRVLATARVEFQRAWGVRWGKTLSVSSESGGIAVELTGAGRPAAGSDQGLANIGAGSSVTYHVSAPRGVRVGVSPMLTDFSYHVTLLPSRALRPGPNTITFTVPNALRDVRVLGLQLDDPQGWKGRLVLSQVGWTPAG